MPVTSPLTASLQADIADNLQRVASLAPSLHLARPAKSRDVAKLTQHELERHLWGAADILSGTVDAGGYQTVHFWPAIYKRLCDVWDEEYAQLLAETGDREEAADRRASLLHSDRTTVGCGPSAIEADRPRINNAQIFFIVVRSKFLTRRGTGGSAGAAACPAAEPEQPRRQAAPAAL